MRRCVSFIVYFCCCAVVSSSDTIPGELWNNPVTYVRIESTATIPAEDVLQAIPIQQGEPLTPVLIRNSLRKLSLLNRFRSVTVYAEPFKSGAALVFRIEPDWIVDKITFKGGAITVLFRYGLGGRFSPKVLQRQMQIGRGDVFTDPGGQAAIQALKDFYFNNGYAQSQITLEPEYNDKDATVDLVFTINQGPATLISDVFFEGNSAFNALILQPQTGLARDQRFSRKRLNESRTKLETYYKRQGYLNIRVFRPEIQYNRDNNTMSVHFRIIEHEPVSIKIQAKPRRWNFFWWLYSLEKRPDLFLEILGIDESGRLDRKRFMDASRYLQTVYWNRGYLNSVVTLQETRDSSGKTTWTFLVEEHQPVITQEILVSGISFFSINDILESNIILTRTGKRYNHDMFLSDRDSLQDVYLQNGFPNVEITSGYTLDQNDTHVALHLAVKEGYRYLWNSVQVTGNTVLTDQQVQDLTGITPNSPYNYSVIETGIDALLDDYLSRGYADIVIDWRVVDEQTTQPSLQIHIIEGIQAVIESVLIKGNNKTLRHVIEKNLPDLEGEPLYFRTILQAERQLIRTNLFRSVEISSPLWEVAQPKRTLLVELTEQPFIFLEGGPGYNTDRGFNAFLSSYSTNLGGSNRYLGISASLSERDHRATVVFREPEFASLPIQLELRLLTEETFEKDYTLLRRGSRSTWSYDVTDGIRLLMVYRFDNDQPRNIQSNAELPEELLKTVKIGSLSPGILFDSRDDPQAPQKGSLLSAKFEFARKMYSSEVNFSKITTEATHFFDVSQRGVLGTALRFGWGYDLPFQEEFRLGGIKSIRGWDYESIRKVPNRSQNEVSSGSRRDIDVSILANFEFRYQIFWGLESVLFFDTGNVFDRSSDIAFSELKGTLGLGIRFMTPVGPIGVDYGYNIMRNDADPSSRWSFIIGHTF